MAFGQHLLKSFSVITEMIDVSLPALECFIFSLPEVAPVTEMVYSIIFRAGL
jgi:hypothetical protein